MPGKNKIALFGSGAVGSAQVKAVLTSGADSFGLREALDVPQIDTKKCCEPPVALIPRDQCQALGPERIMNLEQKYGIRLVSTDAPMPFPKDELLEMKDKLKEISLLAPPITSLTDIRSSSKGHSHRQVAQGMAKKKKAKRHQQKISRRKNH